MKTRKLVLIIADFILLAVLTAQCVLISRDGSKTFRLKETPDEIIIQKGSENVILKYENNNWFVGEKKYPANISSVDSILESLESIRCIDKVGSVSKPNAADKYELNEGQKISVIARKEGTDLRSIDIGKNGSTGSQSFITVDGGKDIYLATGGLRYDFDTSIDQIRSKIVWDFDEAEINAVEVIKTENITRGNIEDDDSWSSGDSFKVAKNSSDNNTQWVIYGADNSEIDIEPDGEKIQSWFDGLGSLTTSLWYDESKDLEKEFNSRKIATVNITHGFDIASIDIYEIPVDMEDDSTESGKTPSYYGKTSENPYPFELTSYTMERLNKNPEELAK